MAIPVARVHLALAHAALPALLPTPPKCNMLPLLPTPCPCVAAILSKPVTKNPSSRADSDERWDARKTKPASGAEPSAASSSSGPRSAHSVTSSGGHGSPSTSPPPKPGRADSVGRWDAHKKAASPASSSSSSGTSSLVSSSKLPISRASSSAERWDVHKKRRALQAELVVDDGESSSTGSNDIDTEEEEEEEILWKPRAIYAGPGFVVAAPEPSMLPMPTTFLVRVA